VAGCPVALPSGAIRAVALGGNVDGSMTSKRLLFWEKVPPAWRVRASGVGCSASRVGGGPGCVHPSFGAGARQGRAALITPLGRLRASSELRKVLVPGCESARSSGPRPDHRTRVIQVRFTSEPDPRNSGAQIRFAVVVLYPPGIKRQLATLEAASARAVDLARQLIHRQCYRPPDLNTLTCNVEITMFDLRPFSEVAWIQEDGTKVWIVEAEQPLPFGWVWRP
jgi:hypothetical protein